MSPAQMSTATPPFHNRMLSDPTAVTQMEEIFGLCPLTVAADGVNSQRCFLPFLTKLSPDKQPCLLPLFDSLGESGRGSAGPEPEDEDRVIGARNNLQVRWHKSNVGGVRVWRWWPRAGPGCPFRDPLHKETPAGPALLLFLVLLELHRPSRHIQSHKSVCEFHR